MDSSHGAGSLGAPGDQQSQGLPPPGQAPNCFCRRRIDSEKNKRTAGRDAAPGSAEFVPLVGIDVALAEMLGTYNLNQRTSSECVACGGSKSGTNSADPGAA